MKRLKEYQTERAADWQNLIDSTKPHPNGIACPTCGKELWDTDPMSQLASYPPQKNIHCPACGYEGFALA